MTTSTNQAPPPHRTQIPNIVDDLGLDPYERALYVHYKRVCGENQGAYCYEAVKTTAQKVKMSTGQVSEARKQLAKRGLILIQDGRPVIVTVLNIWELNTAFYQLEHRPDVDGWTVEQLKLWLADVHTVNVSSHNDSKLSTRSETNLTEDEKDVHPMNVNSPGEHSLTDKDNMSSNIHTVKQRIDSESIESKPIESKRGSPLQKFEPLTQALADVCKINLEAIGRGTGKELSDIQAIFNRMGITPAQMLEFGEWRKAHHWSGKKGNDPPSLKQVGEFWGQYEDWVKRGRPDPPAQTLQKASQNGYHGNKSTKRTNSPAIPPQADPDLFTRMQQAAIRAAADDSD